MSLGAKRNRSARGGGGSGSTCGRIAQGERVRREPGRGACVVGACLGLLLLGTPLLGADLARADGFQTRPNLSWTQGDQKLELTLVSRLRVEFWDAHGTQTDAFYAARNRAGLRYTLGEHVTAFGEFQDVRLYSLSPETSGAGSLYRGHLAGATPSRGHSDRIRQAWLEIRPVKGLALRGGRFDIKLGTEVLYPEAEWKYLKIQRASQRLIGTVGWTHVERTYEGGSVVVDRGGHHVFGFWARPTTGVFDVENAYSRQDDIQVGGVSWTVKRGTWAENSEVRFFLLGYQDDRPVSDGGLTDEVELATAGFSLIGVRPCGDGRADWLLWGAYQHGDFDGLDHDAWAALLELGYQLPDAPGAPWFRIGINAASGDDDPTDGDHEDFFNILPTNHLYYGFADRWALSNIVDSFVQLMLKPCPRASLNLMLHQINLMEDDDTRRFGTGAFTRNPPAAFGYGSGPGPGTRSGATELDTVVTVQLNAHAQLQGGYMYAWGHGLFNDLADDDVRFGYLQVLLRY